MKRDRAIRRQAALARYLGLKAEIDRVIRERDAEYEARGWSHASYEYVIGRKQYRFGRFEEAMNWWEGGNEHCLADLVDRLRKQQRIVSTLLNHSQGEQQ
jgi:hypothetical protein